MKLLVIFVGPKNYITYNNLINTYNWWNDYV